MGKKIVWMNKKYYMMYHNCAYLYIICTQSFDFSINYSDKNKILDFGIFVHNNF